MLSGVALPRTPQEVRFAIEARSEAWALAVT